MAASFVPPKRDIVALIEDVEAAGVRFVYFSPRNMRRSKVPTSEYTLACVMWRRLCLRTTPSLLTVAGSMSKTLHETLMSSVPAYCRLRELEFSIVRVPPKLCSNAIFPRCIP